MILFKGLGAYIGKINPFIITFACCFMNFLAAVDSNDCVHLPVILVDLYFY